MTAVAVPWAIQALSHPATAVRQANQGIFGSPITAFAGGIQATTGGGGHGVISATDLAVSQNGAPNMSVNVAAGAVVIRGTENQFQGCYGPCINDAVLNLAIAAADPTNARKDLIVAKIRDAQYSGPNNDFSLAVVTGTPSGSPVDPAVPANCVVLARVTVGAAVGSIVGADITDLRTRAYALGAAAVCTSTTRPSGASLSAGREIFELDTLKTMRWDGAAWIETGIITAAWTAFTPTLTAGWAFGNATVNCAYKKIGRLVAYRVRIVWGNTSTFGVGALSVSLPFASNNILETGVGQAIKNAGARQALAVSLEGNNALLLVQSAPPVYVGVTNTVPITWANLDSLIFNIVYESTT